MSLGKQETYTGPSGGFRVEVLGLGSSEAEAEQGVGEAQGGENEEDTPRHMALVPPKVEADTAQNEDGQAHQRHHNDGDGSVQDDELCHQQ